MSKVIIIGGGAAECLQHSEQWMGHQVTILEQNEKLGKKKYISREKADAI